MNETKWMNKWANEWMKQNEWTKWMNKWTNEWTEFRFVLKLMR